MLTSSLAANAQTLNGVNVESYTMERSGDFIIVDMDIDISGIEPKSANGVVLTPYIVRDDQSVALKSIGIYGRKRHFYNLRNEDKGSTGAEELSFRSNKAPEHVSYNAIVPFEEWMDGCQLIFERSECGCNNSIVNKEGSTLIARFPLEPYRPTLIYVCPETKAEKEFAISGSAFIDFPVSNMQIKPNYRNNAVELNKIISSINSVKEDGDATIESVYIKGFASPESPYANNDRLAKGRTKALREYVERLFHFEDGFIQTDYEAEDWAGLERFVEKSALENRDAILEIIRSNDTPDNKEWKIKSKYPADYNFMLKNFYPALRHSDYTINYTVRKFHDPVEIEHIMNTAPQKLSLEEFYILAETYEEGSEALNELWETAVRMYPSEEIANLNAANAAMAKGDYERALMYLDKAGDRAEAIYARGALEVLREDYVAAMPYLEQAKALGISEAESTIEGITDHWKVSMAKKK